MARMDANLKYSYSSLCSIMPKVISKQLIFVYTNCERQKDMSFVHPEVNSFFGFEYSYGIPFIFIDNPLV